MSRRGPTAAPNRTFNPAFIEALRSCRRPMWVLAYLTGWPNPQPFSSLISQPTFRATPTTIERLQKAADVLGFPRDQVWLPGDAQ